MSVIRVHGVINHEDQDKPPHGLPANDIFWLSVAIHIVTICTERSCESHQLSDQKDWEAKQTIDFPVAAESDQSCQEDKAHRVLQLLDVNVFEACSSIQSELEEKVRDEAPEDEHAQHSDVNKPELPF